MACLAAKLICAQLHRPSSPKGEELALQQEGRDKSPKTVTQGGACSLLFNGINKEL